jgi:hypothetical protein
VTELLEMVNVVVALDNDWKCPFPHSPLTHDKKNTIPPPEKENNAKKLQTALDTEGAHVENIPLRFHLRKKPYSEEAQFTAHHLIPGNETWPPAKTQLYKWVDDREGHIKGDIGYDVNGVRNGVDLPGHTNASGWGDPEFETRFAFGCIIADKKKRQFHDRHPAYSDFVVNTLNKIAEKLDAMVPNPGCGKKNCGGASAKPYDPPYGLLLRLHGVAARLQGKLTGDARRWKAPLFTSRFALMFTDRNLSQDDARDLLATDQFVY